MRRQGRTRVLFRRRLVALAAALAIVGLVVVLVASSGGGGRAPRTGHSPATAAGEGSHGAAAARRAHRGGPRGHEEALRARRELGGLIVGRYDGRMPSDRLLERVRHGELGGIILFGENTVEGPAGTAAAIDRLQRAARAGGTYPLLIMTDQEGGEVKRFADLPPAHAAALIGSAAQARAEGASTGRALRAVGVNVDLAPVADVEQPGGFLGTRSFG
ncbi:MAG TPA: glycoside hydrolase family 3 N-terminal domain-containing protein, partial [Myxococcales bacterium]|nr:glycoside hydrolase family 3 N-terminal domain-containing protein [Myxococcales bacterium]